MTVDFIDRISSGLKIQRRDMIEKDIILHQVLSDLSKDKFFTSNFVFKGGTCLIKHYLGYLRFSEDIDFTWKDQSRFRGKSGKQVSRDLSGMIDKSGRVFEEIAARRRLDFKCDKADRRYVELGGSNRFCTFKLWYDSAILKRRAFFKVQISFVEVMCVKSKSGNLKSLISGRKEEGRIKLLFPDEYAEYSTEVPFEMYDVKEILSEKIRAVLTRRGVKARDYLDIFFLSKQSRVKAWDVEKCAIEKINSSIGLYEKYAVNFGEKKKLLSKGGMFRWEDEKGLVLTELDDDEFGRFVLELEKYLQELVAKLK